MRKVVILTLVTLFTCVEYSQAQTTEKEMTRQEKKAAHCSVMFNPCNSVSAILIPLHALTPFSM